MQPELLRYGVQVNQQGYCGCRNRQEMDGTGVGQPYYINQRSTTDGSILEFKLYGR